MDHPFGRGLDGIAGLVRENWFAPMGLAGLLLFIWTLLAEPYFEPYATRCIALMMFGWGFGQAECRTLQISIRLGTKIKEPIWRLTVSGAMLFAIFFGSAVALARHWL